LPVRNDVGGVDCLQGQITMLCRDGWCIHVIGGELPKLDTIAWDNGADLDPEFLLEVSEKQLIQTIVG
jgi:hypothetical protein